MHSQPELHIGFLDHGIVDRSRPGRSGLSDIIWDLAGGLVKYGDEVHVAGPYTSCNYPVPEVFAHSYRVHPLAYRNILTQMTAIVQGAFKLKNVAKLDVVHVVDYLPAAFLTSIVPNIPIVLTTPGSILERLSRYNPYDRLTTWVCQWAASRTANTCAHIIATSRDMAYWWQKTSSRPTKITVIPLPVDITIFHRYNDARDQLGWDPLERHLLFVGRLASENRVEILLDAVNQLCSSATTNLRLHIVGDGPLKGRFISLVNDMGMGRRVTWHGSIDLVELPIYYSAADLFVFPRSAGATPRVVLQAMACGATVVCTSNSSLADFIIDGETGLMAESPDAHALCQSLAIAIRMSEGTATWGRTASQYAREKFAVDRVVDRIRNEVYKPLL